jgi:CRP/FNR family transcriptional regulator
MKKGKHNCDLKSCFFCKLALKEWLPAVDVNRQMQQFKKGELIFTEGEVVKGMYFIYDGIAKVHKKWGDDKELIVRFAKQGDIIGHRGLGNDVIYPVSGTALEPLTACFIDLEFFKSSLKVNHELTYQLMLFFAEELQESEKKMRDMAHMPVRDRVIKSLQKIEQKFGTNAEGFANLTITKQDIANFAGTTFETVFRVMNELVADNMIKVSGKTFGFI